MVFPIYLKDDNFVEPEDTVYYLVAGNGVFLVKKQGIYTSSTRTDGAILGLERHEEKVRLRLSRRIPRRLVEQIVGFFLRIYQLYDTEAVVFLYYSDSKDSYRVAVPKQTVQRRIFDDSVFGGSNVKYEGCANPWGFRRIGTVHSHADMPAFHSFQDDRDEVHDDGIHITIGNLDSAPTFSASFVIDGKRLRLNPRRIIGGYHKPDLPPPSHWMKQVRCVTEYLKWPSTLNRREGCVETDEARGPDAPTFRGSYNDKSENRTNGESENLSAD